MVFCEGHSTYMALLRMMNDITYELDNKILLWEYSLISLKHLTPLTTHY